jgi:hypothetical protein
MRRSIKSKEEENAKQDHHRGSLKIAWQLEVCAQHAIRPGIFEDFFILGCHIIFKYGLFYSSAARTLFQIALSSSVNSPVVS